MTIQTGSINPGRMLNMQVRNIQEQKLEYPGNLCGFVDSLSTAQNSYFPETCHFLRPLGVIAGAYNILTGVSELCISATIGNKKILTNGILNCGLGTSTIASLAGMVPPQVGFAATAGIYLTKIVADTIMNSK